MPLTAPLLESCVSNRKLHLVLLPTEACNFRCVYCYESFQLKAMKPWVVSGVKRLIHHRAPGLDALTVSWFGGEPLLELGIIEEVLTEVAGVRKEWPRMALASDITTNGYLLTPPVAERLLSLGVTHYQVSFDGPRSYHDRKRVLHGGRATFDRIWANLRGLQENRRSYSVMVRLHADRENEAALPEFLDAFAAQFGGDPRFELFPRLLSRFGGPNDENLDVYTRDEGPSVLERLRVEAEVRGIRVVARQQGTVVCYASRANSFLIRADGRLSKCTIALDHPNNVVGTIREDGTLDIGQAPMLRWMRGLNSGDDAELHCPMKGLADSSTPAMLPNANSAAPVLRLLPPTERADPAAIDTLR